MEDGTRCWLAAQYMRGVRTIPDVAPPELCLRVPEIVASAALPVFAKELYWPNLTAAQPPGSTRKWPLDPVEVAAHARAHPTVAGYAETACAYERAKHYFENGCECPNSHKGMRWLLGPLGEGTPPPMHPGVARDWSMWTLMHYTACLGSAAQLERLILSQGASGVPVIDLVTPICGLGSLLQVAGFALGYFDRLHRWSTSSPSMASPARRAALAQVIVGRALAGDACIADRATQRRRLLEDPVPLCSLGFCGTPLHVALAFNHGSPLVQVLLDAGASIHTITAGHLTAPGANYHQGPSQEAAQKRPEDIAAGLCGFRDGSSWMISAAYLQTRITRHNGAHNIQVSPLQTLPVTLFLVVLSYLTADPGNTFAAVEGSSEGTGGPVSHAAWSLNYARYRALYGWWSTYRHPCRRFWRMNHCAGAAWLPRFPKPTSMHVCRPGGSTSLLRNHFI